MRKGAQINGSQQLLIINYILLITASEYPKIAWCETTANS